MAKQDDYIRYTIRIPPDAYALLEKAAARKGRSVNAEIIARLASSLEYDKIREPIEPAMKALLDDRTLNAVIDAVSQAIESKLGGRDREPKAD